MKNLTNEQIMKILDVEHPDWIQAPDGFSKTALTWWAGGHRDLVSEVFYN